MPVRDWKECKKGAEVRMDAYVLCVQGSEDEISVVQVLKSNRYPGSLKTNISQSPRFELGERTGRRGKHT